MFLGLSYGEVFVTVGVLGVLIGEATCCKILHTSGSQWRIEEAHGCCNEL